VRFAVLVGGAEALKSAVLREGMAGVPVAGKWTGSGSPAGCGGPRASQGREDHRAVRPRLSAIRKSCPVAVVRSIQAAMPGPRLLPEMQQAGHTAS